MDDLCAIDSAGGSLVLHDDVRPTDALVRIASRLKHGATLTLHGTILRPTEDLCAIVRDAPGQLTFLA